MEKNTVVLDLYDYLALKEFKEKIEKDYIQVTINESSSGRNYYSRTTNKFLTKDEVIIKLGEEINKLKEQAYNLVETGKDLNEKTIQINRDFFNFKEQVKKMSIWEFLKYRKQK